MTDCFPTFVSRIGWTSQKRCDQHPNPKRPRWRCKRPPVWFLKQDRDGQTYGSAVCDEHLAELTGCDG